ncbi:hypothetical protein JW758_04385 [Candidatus Peregrinibacteria bacterium]|nr:hypothetical protein [Candidatus Peregrinibacteria bacterium]
MPFYIKLLKLSNKVAKKPVPLSGTTAKGVEMTKMTRKRKSAYVGIFGVFAIVAIVIWSLAGLHAKSHKPKMTNSAQHNSDEAKKGGKFCDTPNITQMWQEKWREMKRDKNIRSRAHGMEQESKANEICAKFPNEEVCKSFQNTLIDDAENADEDEESYDPFGGSSYASAEDVVNCFVHKDDVLDPEYFSYLPSVCDSYNLIPVEELNNKERLIPVQQVKNVPAEIQQWADQIKPAHLAGLALGFKLLIESNEEFKEMGKDALPILNIIIAAGGDDKGPLNKSAGILIGFYNAGIGMVDNHIDNMRTANQESCEEFKGMDIVPARCFHLMTDKSTQTFGFGHAATVTAKKICGDAMYAQKDICKAFEEGEVNPYMVKECFISKSSYNLLRQVKNDLGMPAPVDENEYCELIDASEFSDSECEEALNRGLDYLPNFCGQTAI